MVKLKISRLSDLFCLYSFSADIPFIFDKLSKSLSSLTPLDISYLEFENLCYSINFSKLTFYQLELILRMGVVFLNENVFSKGFYTYFCMSISNTTSFLYHLC